MTFRRTIPHLMMWTLVVSAAGSPVRAAALNNDEVMNAITSGQVRPQPVCHETYANQNTTLHSVIKNFIQSGAVVPTRDNHYRGKDYVNTKPDDWLRSLSSSWDDFYSDIIICFPYKWGAVTKILTRGDDALATVEAVPSYDPSGVVKWMNSSTSGNIPKIDVPTVVLKDFHLVHWDQGWMLRK
jgi:hypothetical protein